MNTLFTVCGRGNSKEVKNKNIRPFLGFPLYLYTLQAIRLYIGRWQTKDECYDIALSTDSEVFLEQIKSEEDLIIRKRPEALAQDTTPKMPAILDLLEYARAQTGRTYRYIIDLDITSPIRTVKDIRNAYEKKLVRADSDVVFSVVPARRNPYFNMVREKEGFYEKTIASDYMARQQAPKLYDMNASIYVYERAFLESGAKSPLDGKADIILMRDTGVVDIDSEEDFELMELIADYLRKKDKEYRAIFSVAGADTRAI